VQTPQRGSREPLWPGHIGRYCWTFESSFLSSRGRMCASGGQNPLAVIRRVWQQRRLTDDLLLSASRCCCQNSVASNFLIFLLNQSLLRILRELRSKSLDDASSAARSRRKSQEMCCARRAKLRQYIEIAWIDANCISTYQIVKIPQLTVY